MKVGLGLEAGSQKGHRKYSVKEEFLNPEYKKSKENKKKEVKGGQKQP